MIGGGVSCLSLIIPDCPRLTQKAHTLDLCMCAAAASQAPAESTRRKASAFEG